MGTCTDANGATTVTVEAACTTECSNDGAGGVGFGVGTDCNLDATTNTWVTQGFAKCEMLRLDPCAQEVPDPRQAVGGNREAAAAVFAAVLRLVLSTHALNCLTNTLCSVREQQY